MVSGPVARVPATASYMRLPELAEETLGRDPVFHASHRNFRGDARKFAISLVCNLTETTKKVINAYLLSTIPEYGFPLRAGASTAIKEHHMQRGMCNG